MAVIVCVLAATTDWLLLGCGSAGGGHHQLSVLDDEEDEEIPHGDGSNCRYADRGICEAPGCLDIWGLGAALEETASRGSGGSLRAALAVWICGSL